MAKSTGDYLVEAEKRIEQAVAGWEQDKPLSYVLERVLDARHNLEQAEKRLRQHLGD